MTRQGSAFAPGPPPGEEKGGLGKGGWVVVEWPLQVGLNTMAERREDYENHA